MRLVGCSFRSREAWSHRTGWKEATVTEKSGLVSCALLSLGHSLISQTYIASHFLKYIHLHHLFDTHLSIAWLGVHNLYMTRLCSGVTSVIVPLLGLRCGHCSVGTGFPQPLVLTAAALTFRHSRPWAFPGVTREVFWAPWRLAPWLPWVCREERVLCTQMVRMVQGRGTLLYWWDSP